MGDPGANACPVDSAFLEAISIYKFRPKRQLNPGRTNVLTEKSVTSNRSTIGKRKKRNKLVKECSSDSD